MISRTMGLLSGIAAVVPQAVLDALPVLDVDAAQSEARRRSLKPRYTEPRKVGAGSNGRRAARRAALRTARLWVPVEPVEIVPRGEETAIRVATPPTMPSRAFRRAAWRAARKNWGQDDENRSETRRHEWRAAWATCTVWAWRAEEKAKAERKAALQADETRGTP